MRLWKNIDELTVTKKLRIMSNAVVHFNDIKVLGAQQTAEANTAEATAGQIAAAVTAATAGSIAQAAATAASAATATAIAATIPDAIGDTVATNNGWGANSEANADKIHAAIDSLITWATEMDLDYEALLVDAADIRTKFNVAVLHTVELDLDYEALLVDVAAIRTWDTEMDLDYTALLADVAALRITVNSLLAKLRTHGLIAT